MGTSVPYSQMSPFRLALLARQVRSASPDFAALSAEPIAIIGMACRFPGGANSPEALWRLLHDGVDATCEVPADRWDAAALYDPDPAAPGKILSRRGGFLREDVYGFDTGFFEVAPREAEFMDPQHRLLLEVGWEALENAGQPSERLAGSRTGVFIGFLGNDFMMRHRSLRQFDGYLATGNGFSNGAGRLSYFLDLRGPILAIDTACSSSLVATHQACQSLRERACDLALAGGVNLILTPHGSIMVSRMQALAPDGRCKTFDAAADGIARGEGCGLVVLKRLADAVADGDPILAIIRGSAINHGGRSSGFSQPNRFAHEALMREALANGQVEPHQVGYVEAHGTGTALGDPIEVRALRGVYGGRPAERPLLLGSIKTNLGHLEAAAGVASLIKVVLALQHREIPPHPHLRQLNPRLELDLLPAGVPTVPTPWPDGERRIAGVSSFGLSGINAHVLVEEAPKDAAVDLSTSAPALPVVLPLAARSRGALVSLAGAVAAQLESGEAAPLGDLAYTAGVRRSHPAHRLAVVGGSAAQIAARLRAFTRNEAHAGLASGCQPSDRRVKVGFVFSGHGSQWAGMGRGLLERDAAFRGALEAVDVAIRAEAGWSVIDELRAPEPRPGVDVVQPTLFAVAVALAAQWRAWGVEPDAVVGHSMGEIAAAHVAGALSLEAAVQIICRRSRLLEAGLAGRGSMAVVGLPWREVEKRLAPFGERLAIGAINSLESTLISGETAAAETLLGRLEKEGVFCRPVKAQGAGHCAQVDPLLPEMRAAFAGVAPRAGTVPIYSTTTGEVIDGAGCDAEYWAQNARRTVRFAPAIERMLGDGCTLLVEISPHPILLPGVEPMLRQADPEASAIVGSLRRDQDERTTLLEALATLYARGYDVDWRRLSPQGRVVRLPNYPWQRQSYGKPVPGGDAALDDGGAVRGEAEGPRSQRPEGAAAEPARREENLFLATAWRSAPLPEVAAQPTGRWLLLADAGGVADALAARLSAAGAEVVRVARTEIDPLAPGALDRVLREAFPAGARCAGLVHLWGLDHRTGTGMAAAPTETAVEAACSEVRNVIQAIQRAGGRQAPRLWLVTRGAQVVAGGDGAPDVAQAALWGFGRSVSSEHSELRPVLLDMAPAGSGDEGVDLARELLADSAEDEIALRPSGRWVARLVWQPPAPPPAAQVLAPATERRRFRADATYLLCGGLGGLGLSGARWMVDQGARHLLLMGRSGARSAEQQAAVKALEAAGAQVKVAAADVTDREAVAAVLAASAKEQPPLRGVLHAAVVFEAGLLAQETAERIGKVLAPKLLGALHLHELTLGQPLDFFILYSSAASLLGPAGQASYAAANAALDALAHHRRALGLPALAINWGPFSEVGGAAVAGQGDRLARQGMPSMTPDEGNALLGRLLDAGVTQLGAIRIEVPRWIDFVPQIAASPRFSELVSAAAAGRSAGGSATLRQALQGAPPVQRRRVIEKLLCEQMGSILRLEPEQIDRRAPFKSLGVDSLMGLELKNRLAAATELTLPATLAWTYPTISSLAGYLDGELTCGAAPAAAADEEAQQAEELAALPEAEKKALLEKELAEVEDLLK